MVISSPYRDIPVPTVPLHEMLLTAIEHNAKTMPTKPAIVWAEDNSQTVSYQEIIDKSNRVSSYLTSIGFCHGDMLGFVLPNCFEFTYIYIGALRCGGAISGASEMFTKFELEGQFLDARCKIVVTDKQRLEKVLNAVKNCPLIQKVICIGANPETCSENIVDFEVVLKTPCKPVRPFNGSMEDVAVVPYSSGTTGSPKGVMLSHRNYATEIKILIEHFTEMVLPKLRPNGGGRSWYDHSFIVFLPYYHVFGFSLLNVCLVTGMTLVLSSRFDPHVFLSSLEKHRVEFLYCAPPTLLFLTKFDGLSNYNLSSLRVVLTGASFVGKELADEFSRLYKNTILGQTYGLTECTMVSHFPRLLQEDETESVGFPATTFQMKIVDPDTGKEVENGTKGEIYLRSPTVMLGYLNKPQATADAIDKEGWMKTGDIGFIDETGQTRIVERTKEVIKVNGRQVSPSELEDVLKGQSKILDAAVVGIPHPKYGEIPKAFVVPANPDLTSRDVEKIIEERFAFYKWLRGGVDFLATIPKTPSGKILRRFLKEEAISKL